MKGTDAARISGYSSRLDVLKIAFCTAVFYGHFAAPSMIVSGSVGVVGFFVLSGYLLQASFFRMGAGFDISKFYTAKIKRLLPAYVLALIVGIMSLRHGEALPLPSLGKADFSVFAYVRVLNLPAWFVGCMLMYMLLAPSFYYLHRTRWGVALFFMSALLYAAGLYSYYDGTSFTKLGLQAALYYSPWARLWEFLAGMLTYRLFHGVPQELKNRIRLVLSPLLVAVVVSLTAWVACRYSNGYSLPNSFPFSLVIVFMMALLVALFDDHREYASHKLTKTLMWLGALTYLFYLIQWQVGLNARNMVGLLIPGGLPYAATFTFVLLVCVVVSVAVDKICKRIV